MKKIEIRKFLLAAGVLSAVSLGSLAAMTAPAAARVVCDWDGDDCYRTHPDYYERDWGRDWHERHEWEERRARQEAYRNWYWRQNYDGYRPYGGSSVWFNF